MTAYIHSPCSSSTTPDQACHSLSPNYANSCCIFSLRACKSTSNYQELSAILYFLYTNKLNPGLYRGPMLPYGVTQQLTQLVLHQTYYYMFLAVHHVHSNATFRSAHFIVWTKINIARFQRLAISSIAFALPNVQRLLGHILSVYHTDMEHDVFPPFKVLLIECKTCLRHALLIHQTLESFTDIMTHVDHHYVLNRHDIVQDPPMLHAPSPLPSLEMVDNTDEARSHTETLVLDPLNPQQSPIAVGYFHELDEDALSLLSHESIPAYLNVDLPVPPVPDILVEDNPVTPPKRGRDT